MSNITLTPHAFMQAVFPDYLLQHHETPLIAHPASFVKDGLEKHYYAQYGWSSRNGRLRQPGGWTFCISTVSKREKVRRRLTDLRSCFVIPCDDVGTKAAEPPVEPSYVLETSPGNFQWGYLIDPYEVSTWSGAADIDALLLSLAQAGYNDHGCRGAARVVKLPGAVHKSGFITRVAHWAPERVWSLASLVTAFDIPMVKPRGGKRRRPTGKTLAEIKDPVLKWLQAEGHVAAINDRGWAELVACPWGEEHSKGIVVGGDYSPFDLGMPGADFKCMHDSCSERGLIEFLRWVKSKGGPVHPLFAGIGGA